MFYRGKQTCKILKDIRRQIAEENDIKLVIEECEYKGDCLGTCPRCEAEVRYLEEQLAKRKSAGKALRVAGISAAMISLLAPSCAPSCKRVAQPTDTDVELLAGDVVKEPEDWPEEEQNPGEEQSPAECTNEEARRKSNKKPSRAPLKGKVAMPDEEEMPLAGDVVAEPDEQEDSELEMVLRDPEPLMGIVPIKPIMEPDSVEDLKNIETEKEGDN